MNRDRAVAFFVDAAAVLASWAALILAEDVALGFVWREQFSASWEIAVARDAVAPMALAALVPAALVAASMWRLAAGERRRVWAVAGAIAGGALAVGSTTGRHFASVAVRASAVAAVAAACALAGRAIVPRVAALSRTPTRLAALGIATAIASWLGDAFVLPHLYPALHLALLVLSLAGAALVGLAARAGAPSPPSRAARVAAVSIGTLAIGCAAWCPRAARALAGAANVRIVLVERAPLLGRAVLLASPWLPAADDAAALVPALAVAPGEIARGLDWTGRDVVLLSVDALRADHVSAYGYGRLTTPNIDALAREGTLFEHAYCPTPHTSYSVTSMMTGKYLRPLLALGLGDDSDTWASDVRRYGWRTAAFYPPAVFFIDEDRFARFERDKLGFEYAKVEFADVALREAQVREYLSGAPGDQSLFLWVHFFEPHEPYVAHAHHAFEGGRDVDAYDGEVAQADEGVGRIVAAVRERRPGAVFVVTADHGEEFGEHGGRYHGSSVYEEQVRVPLVVAGPGVRQRARVPAVVQTIDLLPTALSALGIPRPPRLRGRDLGPLLAGDADAAARTEGIAFAETDYYALVAAGGDRLVCQRRVGACTLYRPDDDPLQRRDLSQERGARASELRATLRAIERDHGRYESGYGSARDLPEALRRGMQGDAEAAPDVAALLDDANVGVRRKAAEVCFAMRAATTAAPLRRALGRDEDDEVRRWSALALARLGEAPPLLLLRAQAMLGDRDRAWRRRAAIALGGRGDASACDEMGAWWADVIPPAGQGSEPGEPPRLLVDLAAAREMLEATSRPRCRAAVAPLLRALEDVRARPYVADALGAIGDDRARAPLLSALAAEPYVTARPHEARALLALGARDWSAAPAARDVPDAAVVLSAAAGPRRLVVLVTDPSATLEASVDGAPLASGDDGETRTLAVGAPHAPRVRVRLHVSSGGIAALWLL